MRTRDLEPLEYLNIQLGQVIALGTKIELGLFHAQKSITRVGRSLRCGSTCLDVRPTPQHSGR